MRKWMIFTLLLLSSCAIFKEKSRLKMNSLTQLKAKEQWQLTEQWHNREYQFKDSNGLYTITIKADAPFKWQLDSGLTGRAGNYQLHVVQQEKSITAKKQFAQKDLVAENSREEKEFQKSVKTAKKTSSSLIQTGLMLLLILLLAIGLILGLTKIWKRD